MTFEEKKAEILAKREKLKQEQKASEPDFDTARIREQLEKSLRPPEPPKRCKYAQDTGEIAFPAAPCRGNRIICQYPENAGFVSYTKQCRKATCLFFDAET